MPQPPPYDPELLTLLQPRTDKRELYGFHGGRFNSDRAKFFAYTYARLDSVEFSEYNPLFLTLGGLSSVGVDSVQLKKPIDEHSYQMKDMEECIRERIYLAWSIRFTGMLYEGEWFVQKALTFWGEQMTEDKSIAFLTRRMDDPEFWSKGDFGPPTVIDLPDGRPYRNIEEEEFPNAPALVVYLKVEEKRKINRAFERYMNLAFVDPFLQRMRIRFPDEYVDFSPFYPEHTLLYPRERSCFLLVTMAQHRVNGYRLVWFFYEPPSDRFYRWTYPQPCYRGASYGYIEEVIETLKNISEWNDFQFLLSSRTLDDPKFWAEFVCKKQDGRYSWLEPID